MDVLDVLEGFCALEKRSETLDGSVPLKAAQGCKPLLEGNAAGFQLRLTEPSVIRVGRSGPTLVLTDEGYAHVTAAYAAKIAHVVERGLLARGGYWHQELSKGFAWTKGTTFSLWTGHLVRPVPGVWLLVSGRLNHNQTVVAAYGSRSTFQGNRCSRTSQPALRPVGGRYSRASVG
jgi:hypothetical protein